MSSPLRNFSVVPAEPTPNESTSKSKASGVRDKIKVEGLHKTYLTRTGRTVALQNVDLTIGDDEFIALVGPSGCGKSTLLRLISALIKPSKGKILMDGVPITGPSHDVGIVFQQAVLLPWRNVLDNVLLPAEILGLDMKAARERAHQLLELVGLAGFETRNPHELSGGMQQRVNLARALATDPEILLMDEPFAALDAQTREFMQAELLRIWTEANKTVMFITHQIDEAVYLADRVFVFGTRPGRMRAEFDIPFERPRKLSLKRNPEFLALTDQIWTLIEEEASRAGLMQAANPAESR